jgi:hypothetical protein
MFELIIKTTTMKNKDAIITGVLYKQVDKLGL